jgi:hypothetical protein
MRRASATVALALGCSASAAAAPPFGTQHSSAVASPATAGSRAALTLKLSYPMTCGQPGRGPVVVTLPTAPRKPTRTTVLVAGKAPPSVGLFGRTVTIGLPKPPEVICQSITEGTLRIRFATAAGFRNPARAGRYPITARIGNRTFTPLLAIH